MTIDEAIKHAEEVAEEKDMQSGFDTDYSCYQMSDAERNRCKKCAKEHRQLAEWLKELKQLREQTRWIPVNERLPKPYTWVYATCKSLVDDRENWVIDTCYVPLPKEYNSKYSDWGNIPMLNWGQAEVIAWMKWIIPEPYKASPTGAESEVAE